MPTYEYVCTNSKCSHEWEADQSIKDSAIKKCPKCKKRTAKRLISLSSFELKGGCWGRDNYSK